MPLNRFYDPSNRFKLFPINDQQQISQLSSIDEEEQKNPYVNIPKYGSFNIQRAHFKNKLTNLRQHVNN